MTREIAPRTEINSSLLSLFDTSMLYTAFWPMYAFADTVYEAGYEGLEWHPVRGLRAGIDIKTGMAKTEDLQAIKSLHQSYRNEKSLNEVWNHSHRTLAAFAYLLLPERVDSLKDLEFIQESVGKELPVVLYDPHDGEKSGTNLGFPEKLIQPAPNLYEKWDAALLTKEFLEKLYQKGYTGLCLDLYHMRATNDRFGYTKWEDALPILLPHTKEIHVSAGRVDQDQPHIDTISELLDLIYGRTDRGLLKMLAEVKKMGWHGKVVTEIPASAIHRLNPDSKFLDTKSLIWYHKRIVENIQNVLLTSDEFLERGRATTQFERPLENVTGRSIADLRNTPIDQR